MAYPFSRFLCLLVGLLVLLAGCTKAPWHSPVPLRPGMILAAPHGRVLSQGQLAARVARARVVLVGETHDHRGHKKLQKQILSMALTAGGPLILGVEWLEAPSQPVCDRLSAGKLTLPKFFKEVNWSRQWSDRRDLFAPILALVPRPGLRLVALNAPRKVIRKIARQGLEALSASERAQIAPALDLNDPLYRARLQKSFRAHGMKGGALARRFFTAQVARDETMAHNLARALGPWPDGAARAVVLVGQGHMYQGLGLPPRLRRRLPGVPLLSILPLSPAQAAVLRQRGRWPAQVMVLVAPQRGRRPLLGVILRPAPAGLRVARVLPGSAAHKGGIKPGDLLLAVDGRPLKRIKDIHDALRQAPFKEHRYLLQRKQRRLTLEIRLAPPPKPRAE